MMFPITMWTRCPTFLWLEVANQIISDQSGVCYNYYTSLSCWWFQPIPKISSSSQSLIPFAYFFKPIFEPPILVQPVIKPPNKSTIHSPTSTFSPGCSMRSPSRRRCAAGAAGDEGISGAGASCARRWVKTCRAWQLQMEGLNQQYLPIKIAG